LGVTCGVAARNTQKFNPFSQYRSKMGIMSEAGKPSRKSTGSFHTTLKDVAKLANVSTKTVSRVVNNQGEISAETRVRVQAAIEQLGYRPNVLARSLIRQHTNTLGVVAWGIDYFGPSRTVVGIEQQVHQFGYSLYLNLIDLHDNGDINKVLDTLITHRVDGILWAVPEVGDNRVWLESTQMEQLPPVVFLSMQPRPGLAIVSVDNFSGAKQAASHLIEAGRRKIGIITGPLSWWEARERLGWLERGAATGWPGDTPFIDRGRRLVGCCRGTGSEVSDGSPAGHRCCICL
jgi:LacI family transcriptional regulator